MAVEADDFMTSIESMVSAGATYADAVVTWCEKRGVDVDVGAEQVERHPAIKSRMMEESERLFLLRRSGRLPL